MKNLNVKHALKLAAVLAAVAAMAQTAGAHGTFNLPTPAAPDAASTAGLLGVAFSGLAMLRKFRG